MPHRIEIYETHRPPRPRTCFAGWALSTLALLLAVAAGYSRLPLLIPLSLLGLSLAGFLITEGRNAHFRYHRDPAE